MKHLTIFCLFFLIACSISGISKQSFCYETPFTVMWDKTPLHVKAGERFETIVEVIISKEHFIYADKTHLNFITLEGVIIEKVDFPTPIDRQDPHFSKTMPVYENALNITITGKVPSSLQESKLELISVLEMQGCSEKLCFKPETHEIKFNINILASNNPQPEQNAQQKPKIESSEISLTKLLNQADLSVIFNQGIALSIIVVFLAGFLVSLTPCVWPIIPIVLTIIGIEAQKSWIRNLLLSLTMVVGIVIINSGMGILAVALGKSLGFLFQSKIFLIFVILFFLTMSMAMFGVFDFNPLKRFHKFTSKLGGKGFRGAFLAGLGIGLVATPCASPVLASVLGYVATKQNYFLGFGLLFTFGLGMGTLFIIVGSFFGVLSNYIKSGKWMIRVRFILGILILVPVIFYLKVLMNFNHISKDNDPSKIKIEWIYSIDDAFRFAKDSNRPIMIDFFAEWCPPCISLDKRFFNKENITRISYKLVPLKVDATTENAEEEAIISKYNIIGWPTIIFLSPDGKLYEDLTVISEDPEQIENNMLKAISRAEGK
ncbi:MAG: hypothetical protein COS89_08120 [Deltaproteobacteria bacterium CG07_land_8_20_14_0_80_38_7]|nr:MAG: hypothetical protein COS89_08120 [Deltaproteobacteria bacterium CG07_land_8_20_14_0_80_38_7]